MVLKVTRVTWARDKDLEVKLTPWEGMRWSHPVRRERVHNRTTQTPTLRGGKLRKLKWKQKAGP